MNIKIVYGDDWQGLYINNVLKSQGHKIEFYEIISEINKYIDKVDDVNVIEFEEHWCDLDWLDDEGELPSKYEDVVIPNYSNLF